MKITIFSEELRKCLNAAGLSDCGENDTWNYWYQRLMNAYNESVERQIMTEQTENAKLRDELDAAKHDLSLFSERIVELGAENAKLRELVRDVYALHWNGLDCTECPWFDECDTAGGCPWLSIFADHMRELGIEVNG